ncbi:thioesterase domain-containing protein [Mesorhizobium marinum]|uniref:thioesterase domain-containing protein n=1 Tax=Mesorhizobium marinum TaxID=3228790 RepID=UPI003467DEE8
MTHFVNDFEALLVYHGPSSTRSPATSMKQRCLQWIVMLAAILLLSLPAGAASTRYRGDVYLLRGFGDVFSEGLDQLGADFAKAGVPFKVVSHGNWRGVATTIIANQKKSGPKPVVLIGHSLGANNAIRVAQRLKTAGIKVTWLVTLAATAPPLVPSNVRKVTNHYFSHGGWGAVVHPGPGFRGRLENIDHAGKAEIGHFNLDQQPAIQRALLRRVKAIVRP